MTGNEGDPVERSRRRWVVWGTVGAVAAVAVAAAIVVPLLRPGAAPAPSPSATTTATPTATTEPTPSCTVTAPELTWSEPNELTIAGDGRLAATRIQRIEGVREQPGMWADDAAFAIDDGLVGVLTRVDDAASTSYVSVIEPSGAVRWTRDLTGYVIVMSTPASTGVPGQLVLLVRDDDGAHRLVAYDLARGDVLRERETGELYAVTQNASRASYADVASVSADAFFASDRESLSRINAATLETEWSVRGDDFGVGWFEGGVPFDVTQDVVFVGTHAVDARSGEALGWESAGAVFEAAGATLQTPLMYDRVDAYETSGLDTATGESCWTREILDVAASDDMLWVLSAAGMIERIDPFTGTTLEQVGETAATALLSVGDRVIAVESDPDDFTVPARYTVYDGSAEVGTLEAPSDRAVFTSGDQLLVYDHGTVDVPATLSAYELPGTAPVWQVDGAGMTIDAGVVLRTTWDAGTGRVDVELLR